MPTISNRESVRASRPPHAASRSYSSMARYGRKVSDKMGIEPSGEDLIRERSVNHDDEELFVNPQSESMFEDDDEGLLPVRSRTAAASITDLDYSPSQEEKVSADLEAVDSFEEEELLDSKDASVGVERSEDDMTARIGSFCAGLGSDILNMTVKELMARLQEEEAVDMAPYKDTLKSLAKECAERVVNPGITADEDEDDEVESDGGGDDPDYNEEGVAALITEYLAELGEDIKNCRPSNLIPRMEKAIGFSLSQWKGLVTKLTNKQKKLFNAGPTPMKEPKADRGEPPVQSGEEEDSEYEERAPSGSDEDETKKAAAKKRSLAKKQGKVAAEEIEVNPHEPDLKFTRV